MPRSAQTIAKWKESLGDTSKLADHLSERHQIIVCQMIGQFLNPDEISARMKKYFGVSILPSSIDYYKTHHKWIQLVEK